VSHSGGGVLNGAGTLTVNGPYNWTDGSMDGGGATLLNSGMTMSGTGFKSIGNRSLTNANNGTINWTGGALGMSGATSIINNLAGSTFDIQTPAGSSQSNSSVFNNGGTLRKSAGSGTVGGFSLNNTGTVQVDAGTLTFGGTFTQTAGSTVLAGGSISKSGSAMMINGGTIGLGPNTASGTITGSVTLGNAAASTVPRPGAPGTLTVTGAYTQTAGKLAIELGGVSPGTGHDQLVVSGTATLRGTLELTLINGFTPTVGQQFTILTAGARTGTFASVVLNNFPGNLGASVSYTATTVVVTITSM
ncbi:MAG TPA: hypothetical protein VGM03_10730, partial [Phycisphaerae bacterium]